MLRVRKYKSHQSTMSQEQRRISFLENQKEKRRNITENYRLLNDPDNTPGMLADSSDVNLNINATPAVVRKHHNRKFYNKQLCTPEWMIEVPGDLIKSNKLGGWFVMIRPEGVRCLVIASHGRTASYLLSGDKLHTFFSVLPGGGAGERIAGDVNTILDCIFSPTDNTYYVLDIMSWKDYLFYDCSAEFRFYWLRNKMEELIIDNSSINSFPGNTGGHSSLNGEHPLRTIPYFDSTVEGLQSAYSLCNIDPTPSSGSYIADGLLFYHKEGRYELGLTPLVILWKDQHSTRYFSTGEESGERLAVVLMVFKVSEVDSSHEGEELFEIEGMMDNNLVNNKEEIGNDTYDTTIDHSSPLPEIVVAVSEASLSYTYQLVTMDLFPLYNLTHNEITRLKLADGDLVRCAISDVAMDSNNRPSVIDLQLEQKCSHKRPLADCWSKLVFQSRQRTFPIVFDDIITCAYNALLSS